MAQDKRPVLRTTAPYTVGFLSPLLESLDVLLNLFQFIATGICRKDREAGMALGHYFLSIINEESAWIIPKYLRFR